MKKQFLPLMLLASAICSCSEKQPEATEPMITKQSFEKFKAQCIAEGARDGQFKMNLLMQDEKRHQKFKTLVLDSEG